MRAFLKTTETFAPGALSLPGRYYTSQDVFAAEREAIFASHWTCVGRAEDIEKAHAVDESVSIDELATVARTMLRAVSSY